MPLSGWCRWLELNQLLLFRGQLLSHELHLRRCRIFVGSRSPLASGHSPALFPGCAASLVPSCHNSYRFESVRLSRKGATLHDTPFYGCAVCLTANPFGGWRLLHLECVRCITPYGFSRQQMPHGGEARTCTLWMHYFQHYALSRCAAQHWYYCAADVR